MKWAAVFVGVLFASLALVQVVDTAFRMIDAPGETQMWGGVILILALAFVLVTGGLYLLVKVVGEAR